MEFRSAETMGEALSLLAEMGSEAAVLAGGTDVMVQYLRGEIKPGLLLHIERLDHLRKLDSNRVTTVGALVTHRRLATDAVVGQRHPGLAEAAARVGGWQTQAIGTLGGNICNASPAADTAPPLLAANGQVTLASARGERTLGLAEFFVDRRSTARRPDELVTALTIEPLPARSGETYLKLGRRGAMEVAIVGLALRLGFSEDGTVTRARVAVCSVAPTPQRVSACEQALEGSRLQADAVDEAAQNLVAAAKPIDDARANAHYRLRVLHALLARASAVCRRRAGLAEVA